MNKVNSFTRVDLENVTCCDYPCCSWEKYYVCTTMLTLS